MKQLIVLVFLILLLIFPGVVSATDMVCNRSTGSYGQATVVCKTPGEEAFTVTHVTAGTGLADVNFWVVAGSLIVVSGLFISLAKLAERIYWFE